MQLILASNSWIRIELLDKIKIPYIKDAPNVDEEPLKNAIQDPRELVIALAKLKAQTTAQKYKGQPYMVLGSDSVNLRGSMVCNKPKTKEEAFRMIKAAENNTDTQITAFHLINTQTGQEWSGTADLNLIYGKISDEAIHKYLEEDDKAFMCSGGYAIHTPFFWRHCKRVEGSNGNFHALPIEQIIPILEENGVKL